MSLSDLDNNSWSSRYFCWFPFYCIRLYDHYYLSLKESPICWLKQEERTISLEESGALSFRGEWWSQHYIDGIFSLLVFDRERGPRATLTHPSHSASCLLDVTTELRGSSLVWLLFPPAPASLVRGTVWNQQIQISKRRRECSFSWIGTCSRFMVMLIKWPKSSQAGP